MMATVASLVLAAPPVLEEIERLQTTARVLYVAAHPDDENTRLISALTIERRAEVAYLSLTRGSGGQNRIGTEQGDLLGVLRTRELVSARTIDGGRQYFSRARDFGYSKSVEETLRVWDEDAVLGDIAAVIDEFRPDVVVTRFREGSRTHGHHLASAVLARRALERGPNKRTGWRPKRLVLNIPTWRGPAEDAEFDLVVGGYAPGRELTTTELAALSRSQHRSQGFGSAPVRAERTEEFKHVWGEPAKSDLLDDVDAGWARLGDDGTVEAALARAAAAYRPRDPAAIIPPLLEARAAMAELADDVRVRDHIARIDALVLRAAGVFVRATTVRAGAAVGSDVPVEVEVANRAGRSLRVESVVLGDEEPRAVGADVAAGAPWRLEASVRVPDGELTATPWLRGITTLQPAGPAAMTARVALVLDGHRVDVAAPLRRVWVDRSMGERSSRFERLPPVTARPAHAVRFMPGGGEGIVAFELRRHDGGAHQVGFEVPDGWSVEPAEVDLDADARTISVRVAAPRADAPPGMLRPVLLGRRKKRPLDRLDRVDHPHVEPILALRPSAVRMVPVDLVVPDIRVGYVPGSGDRVAEILTELGLSVRVLGEAQVAEGDFEGLDVVLTGVRAFNVNPTLAGARRQILDWVEQGGRLVVQYNTNNWFDALAESLGPGKLELGRGRVTDETAAVRMLAPEHPIWSRPHRLGAETWDGWVQERGLYFAASWDDGWTPLVELADPGEDPQRGALLIRDHGEGEVVYAGLSFFRQLPAGVPGAVRLLVNLLAHD